MKAVVVKVSHHKGLKRPRHGMGKVKVFVDPVDETVMENFLGGRFNRPVYLLKNLVADGIAKAAEDGTYFRGSEELKFRWSQKAGCQCPCSPGFVTNLTGYDDVFVSYRLEDD